MTSSLSLKQDELNKLMKKLEKAKEKKKSQDKIVVLECQISNIEKEILIEKLTKEIHENNHKIQEKKNVKKRVRSESNDDNIEDEDKQVENEENKDSNTMVIEENENNVEESKEAKKARKKAKKAKKEAEKKIEEDTVVVVSVPKEEEEEEKEKEEMIVVENKEEKTTVDDKSSSDSSSKEEIIINKEGVTILLFYSYVEPEWTHDEHNEAIAWGTKKAAELSLGGRLRVAREGFNGTLTGNYDNVRGFAQSMRDWRPDLFSETEFKFTDNLPPGQHFPSVKVFPVSELVNYGLSGKQPSLQNGGIHLPAEDYHKKMEEPNSVIIDVRNSYEADIGRFAPPENGAKYIDPKMRVSTEFPKWVDNNKEELKGKQILMYCTGGIRCERASALLRDRGYDNDIFQLQGGIDNYLKKYQKDGGHWVGKNYVFDKRFAHGADNAEVVGKCSHCKKPWDKYRGKKRCTQCGVPLLICDGCQEKKLEKFTVCLLCQEEGKNAPSKVDMKNTVGGKKSYDGVKSCGVCKGVFKSRNELFKHLKESGHMDRKSKKKPQGGGYGTKGAFKS